MGSAAPSILFLLILESVLLTIPASLLLILLYRRAVGSAMLDGSLVGQSGSRGSPPFAVQANVGAPASSRLVRFRLTLIYSCAGASAAALWTWFYLHSLSMEFTALRGFALWYALCWPVPITLITLLGLTWRRSLWLVTRYVAAGALVLLIWSAASELISGKTGMQGFTNVWFFLLYLLIQASPGAILIAAGTHRRIRGVSPLALASLLIFAFSSFAATQAFVILIDVGDLRIPLLAIGLRWWWMVVSLPVGYLCWLLLSWLNSGYMRKSFSDVQLVADSFWIIVAFLFAAECAGEAGWSGAFALTGFLVYRSLVQLGFWLWRTPTEPGPRLLVLRVFGFRRRTEKLFDGVTQPWRFRGDVIMIAGTDVAARTMDPDSTLAFLSGRFRSRYISNTSEIEAHLERLDEKRDPDGRFRVCQFYCHRDTWSGAVTALLGRSDKVLMDLRGFSERNCGCIFELHQIAAHHMLSQTLFIVDETTDMRLLGVTVGEMPERLNVHVVEPKAAGVGERVYRSLCLLQESGA